MREPRFKVSNRPMEPTKLYNGTPCMPWPGTLSRGGYGRICIKRRAYQAHRVIYENVKGPIPKGLVLDHLCRNRKCVNPDHLEPVTNRENLIRGVGFVGINAAKTICHKGHPLSGENLRIWPRKNGLSQRHCRECWRQRLRDWRAKKREQFAAGLRGK